MLFGVKLVVVKTYPPTNDMPPVGTLKTSEPDLLVVDALDTFVILLGTTANSALLKLVETVPYAPPSLLACNVNVSPELPELE